MRALQWHIRADARYPPGDVFPCFWVSPVARPLRAHHPIGDAVGLLLVRVVWLTDTQLGLDYARFQQALHSLVAEGPVKLWMRRDSCPRASRGTNGRPGERAGLMRE